jgi:HTH-type transcriptional regulator/antitoxin HigA
MSTNTKIERELLSKPGDTILETIEHLRMSQAELAERLGKTPAQVNDLISGKGPLTVNTALQLEKVLGIDMQFWLNSETRYREKIARLEQDEFLEQSLEWLKEQPIKDLQKLGYIKSEKIGNAMVDECLQFYGVASPVQWGNVYLHNYGYTNFRRSLAHKTLMASMAAWLRIGELKIQGKQLPEFSKSIFKETLSEIKKIVEFQPEDFALQLKSKCEAAGVAVVYSKCLQKAPISGAARWIGGIPVIQITDRYKTNDQFWHTFYHEAGHITLHGKKDVFIEGEDFERNEEKEEQADEFASQWLLSNDFLEEISGEIDERTIRRIARNYQTHPAIVLGRLQKLQKVPYHFGSALKARVDLEYFIEL